MNFQSPGALLFELGPLKIRYYGLMFVIGFLSATYFASKLGKRWGIETEQIVNLTLACFLGGIIGSRLYYAALNWSSFSMHPLETFAIWNGGLSIQGGIFVALFVGIWYCRHAKLPILKCCDLISSVLPLGQAIGRWGNFFNSEAFGKPVTDDFPLRLYIAPEHRPQLLHHYNYFHPTFLYESIWDLFLFLVLYFYLVERLKKYPGISFFIYLAAYSCGRFLIESIRIDSIMLFGLPAPSIVCAITLGIALVGILVLMKKYSSQPPDAIQPEASKSAPSNSDASGVPETTKPESSQPAEGA